MTKAILLACMCIAVSAQGFAPEKFGTGKLVKISNSGSTYSYTVETNEDGYTGTSPKAIRLTEGSQVNFAFQGRLMYIIDDDGKPQELTAQRQYLKPPPPPPRKK